MASGGGPHPPHLPRPRASAGMTAPPRLIPVAGHAILVEFAGHEAPAGSDAAARVEALDRALARAPFPGLVEVVPALVNLLVLFDPERTDLARAGAALQRLAQQPDRAPPPPATHDLAACYDPPFAPDLAEVARRCGLSPGQVVAAHLGATFRVAMYGFAPGYAYLSGLPPPLHLPRKPAPRRDVPAGSVLIAGSQCLVSTLTMPTGWWVIGRSPAAILTGDAARPFLLARGDRVRFHRVAPEALQ